MKTFDFPINLGYNLLTQDLEHLYNAMVELMKAAITPLVYENTTNVFRLTGGVWSVSGNDYTVTDGFYFFNGEIYQIDGDTFNSATEIPVLEIDETVEASEPHQVSDGTNFTGTHEIKKTRKLVPTLGTAGSGLADYNELREVLTTDWTVATLLNNWKSDNELGVPGTYHNFQYKKEGHKVFVRGLLLNTSTPTDIIAYVLPVGFRPLREQNIIISDQANVGKTLTVKPNGEVSFPLADSAFISDNTFFFID